MVTWLKSLLNSTGTRLQRDSANKKTSESRQSESFFRSIPTISEN